MRRLHWTLILLLAAVSVAAVANWRAADDLRRKNDELSAQCQALQAQLEAANAKQNSPTAAALKQQKRNAEELLRLRSEVTQLRTKAADAAKLRAENQQLRAATTAASLQNSAAGSTNAPAGGSHPRDSWAFSGYATPEATLVSAIWAMREGNPRAFLDSLSPDEAARQAKQWGDKTEADIAAKHQQDVASITGFQIMSSQNISPDEVQMNVFVAGPDKLEQVSVARSGSDWKFAGFVQPPPK